MPRKMNRDQAASVSVYEASPGRAPAGARDGADELLPPEDRFSDEERARPSLTWLHQEAASGTGARAGRRGERRTGSDGADTPPRRMAPGRASSAAAPAPIAVVVEDDETVRDIAAAILDETDLEVIACDSAEAALAVMREHGSDVAMLFTAMQLSGEMDGAALARTVELDWPDVRLVLTSRPGETQAVPDHVVYMPKPWRPDDVMAAVTNLRRLRSA